MLFIFPTALFFEAAALVSIPHTHSRPIVMALSNWIGPSQWDIFRQAGLMIGFGAGVGQMNAIFGLQTFCNEQVGGGKRACVEEQRSCCWPSKLRDLPASPWDKSVTLGLMAGLLLPLAWILYTTCAGEKCSLNRAVDGGELKAGLCFLWRLQLYAPIFRPHNVLAACWTSSQYQRGETGAFPPKLRCLNIYSGSMRFVQYMRQCWGCFNLM